MHFSMSTGTCDVDPHDDGWASTLKILWYWPHPHRQTNLVARAVVESGHELVVQALPSHRGDKFEALDEYRVVRDLPDPTIRSWNPLRKPLVALRRSWRRRILVKENFDVLHVEMLTYQLDWVDLPRLARRIPTVISVHDVLPHGRTDLGRIRRATYSRLYGTDCDFVVFHHRLKTQMVSEFGVDERRIHIVPHPLKPLVGDELPTIRPRGRVLFFGTLRENKGIDRFLACVNLAHDQAPALRFQIAGSGSPSVERDLRRAAHALPNLDLELGHADMARKDQLFRSASVVVLPYRAFSSQSGVLFDAYRYGLPLVVSDSGALGDTVRDDRSGFVVDCDDPSELMSAISELAGPTGDECAAAVRVASTRHEPENVAAALLSVYKNASKRFRAT